MKRNFKDWFMTFTDSISTYDYYVDFDKVNRNIEGIAVELNILNSLLGSKNIKTDYLNLMNKYPEVLKCIPILLAIRGRQIFAMDEDGKFIYDFISPNLPPSQYLIFMEKTGLLDLISNRIIGSLVDYARGVEVGLDSNGRKNRGGHLMENLVERYLIKAGFTKNTSYFKEVKTKDIEKRWNLDLSSMTNMGKTIKRFDFVVDNGKKIFAIETNFYASHGSKLNETARSYKILSLEAKSIDRFEFVWFTDGKGWKSARNNLEETFDIMDNIYNIYDLENDVMNDLFK